jgi:glycogen synthase
MQICLHSAQFFPVIGGIPQVSYTLANYWVQQGHKVIVVTDTPASADQNTAFNFPVIRCPSFADWKHLLRNNDVIVSKGYSIRHLMAWLISGKPIIWIHPVYIPEIVESNKIQWRSLIRILLARAILPLAASHVYVSHAVEKQIGSPKGLVIYNPVESCFRPLPNIITKNDFAFFGRMDPEKGVNTLLEALAICKQKGKIYTLDLYGFGPYLAEWQELAKTLGIGTQVNWYPFLRGNELVEAMNATGVVVMPSQWSEPMGLVAVEAMACGKAVIGSQQGGLGEVLRGYGMTFENGNTEQLAECMIKIQENPDLRLNLEQKGYERARDFTLSTIGDKYLQLFESILKHSPSV